MRFLESVSGEKVLPWLVIRQVRVPESRLVMLIARKHVSNLLEEGTRPERLGEPVTPWGGVAITIQLAC